MKKIINLLLLLLVTSSAFADTAEIDRLKANGMSLGLANEVDDIYISEGETIVIPASSTFTTLTGTASPSLIVASTADAADSSSISVAGGGAVGSTRGSSVTVTGNENASTGQLVLEGGNLATSHINNVIRGTNAEFRVSFGGNRLWSIPNSGNLTQDATNGGNIVLSKASTAVAQPIATGLTSTGTTIADALQLTAVYNRFAAVGASSGAKLWDAPAGSKVCTLNATGTALLLYPSGASDTISGNSAGVAVSIASGATACCDRYVAGASGTWGCTESGAA